MDHQTCNPVALQKQTIRQAVTDLSR